MGARADLGEARRAAGDRRRDSGVGDPEAGADLAAPAGGFAALQQGGALPVVESAEPLLDNPAGEAS